MKGFSLKGSVIILAVLPTLLSTSPTFATNNRAYLPDLMGKLTPLNKDMSKTQVVRNKSRRVMANMGCMMACHSK